MTSFQIDTGVDEAPRCIRFGKLDSMAWDILEALPQDPTQAQIDGMIAQIVMGELREPKRLDTVRRRLTALWPIIAQTALTSPDTFDEILIEYAERASSLR
jgi:hypothetical protein